MAMNYGIIHSMVVLIGEVTSSLQRIEDSYELSFIGIVEPASILKENGIPFKVITKLSRDGQGEMQRELLIENSLSEDCYLLSSPLLSSLMVDYDMRLKGTAPSAIEKEELLSLLRQLEADCVILSESIMSVEPAASEITRAIMDLEKRPKVVVYSNPLWPHVEQLETLKCALDSLAAATEVYTMSQSVLIDNLIMIERSHLLDVIR